MTKEEAIKWLGNLRNDLGNPHYECLWPYAQTIDEICELLKSQEPRVMTPEEVRSLPEGSVVWFEERDNGGRAYIQPMMSTGKAFMIGTHLDINVSRGALNWANRRFWTSRPAEEQMDATPWDS